MAIINPIPSLPESRPLELEEWLFVEIQPRECSELLRRLQQEPAFSLPDHLKRVRPTGDGTDLVQVLLCRAADIIDNEQQQTEFWSQFPVERRKRCQVPRHRPYSPAAASVWRQHWPCSYRPFVPSSPPLTPAEDQATRLSLHRLHLLALQGQASGRPYAAAMLVSPKENVQLASSFDWSDGGHSLEHPVMALAKQWGLMQRQLHQARIGTVTSSSSSSSEGAPRQTMPDVYLFTHLDVYLTDEPCVMCAMALLHSRVRRVVCQRRNAEFGALAGSMRLHCQPGLNHKYQVYCADGDAEPSRLVGQWKRSGCCYC